MTLLTADEWTRWIAHRPEAHLLQTAEWGELKARFGWRVERVVIGDSGAQVLFRRLPFGFTLAYIPMGPVEVDLTELLPALDSLCRSRRAVLLKVEPDPNAECGMVNAEFCIPHSPFNILISPHTIQPPRTLLVSLDGFPDAVLARMKQKTRYNVGLARKKGVTVRESADIAVFNSLMQTTGQRDEFGVHTPEYYQKAFDLFRPRDVCRLFLAYFEERPLAGVMVFARGARAWYLYGASANEHRDLMPAYLLQWEAMRWAAERGCNTYDLYGVPDCDEAALEAQFTSRSDGLWGVYRFKRGFGGEVVRAPGAFDRVYSPGLYRLYRWYARRRESA